MFVKRVFSVGTDWETLGLVLKKTVFSVWASTLNMGLINKVDMVCLSAVGFGVEIEKLLLLLINLQMNFFDIFTTLLFGESQ